jgi:hypothetical protein
VTGVLAALFAGVLGLLAIGVGAYHQGRRRGRVTLAADLITELRHHKLECIGEPAERVALEIGLLCETDPTVRR